MIKLLEKLLNLIYIKPCYFCKSPKEDKLLCSRCYSKIRFLPKGVVRKISYCDIYAATIYDGIIKTLVKDLKYYKKKKLAFIQAQIMFEYWQQLDFNENFVVLPVPIHEHRLKERKYNHMDLVAQEFCKLSRNTLNNKFLLRIKDTQKQFKLNKRERIQNIRNAFDIDKENAPDLESNILIVDDITSTGITLEEIIKVLRKNGYKNIKALTLATPDIWN